MTKKINWTEKLTTEIVSLDAQHMVLFQLFNDFIDALGNKVPQNEILHQFENIIAETLNHFAYEEHIMRNIGFQGYSDHKSHHETLRKDAELILNDLKAGKSGDDIGPSVHFLRALVVKHMVEQDLKISTFITQGTQTD